MLRGILATTVAVAATLTVAQAAHAQTQTPARLRLAAYPNVDARAKLVAHAALTTAQRRALGRLGRVHYELNDLTGVPTSLIRYGGYLTKPSKASPRAIAEGFLRRNAAIFGLSRHDLANIVLTKAYLTGHNGVTQVFFRQMDRGRAVYGSDLSFAVDRKGRIAIMGGLVYPGITAPLAPRLSAAEAVGATAASIGLPRRPVLRGLRLSFGPSARTVYANTLATGVHDPTRITAELVLFPVSGRKARLAWRTELEATSMGWYDTVVDASTGQVLSRVNNYSDAGPEGKVFTGQHSDIGSQQIVSFAGWVSGRTTSGNNANAYQDLTETNAPGYQPQTPDTPDPSYQHFDYTFTDAWFNTNGSATAVTTTDRDPVVTQLFYYTNMMHDYLYALGFDEAAGNFQQDNFGNGGSGGDPVQAEADDGFDDGVAKHCKDSGNNDIVCRNNANFGTNNDGSTARMQMYLFTNPPNAWRDGDMDGDVIAHEYGHGLSRRLVGGGTGYGGGVQASGMNEGWSDIVDVSVWNDTVVGEYVTGNSTRGIRRYDYATSPEKYSDLGNAGYESHNDGEIWATAVIAVRTKFMAKYGNAAGAQKLIQLVVDGMKDTNSTPTFLSGRDGLLAADMTDNGGANQCLIWGAFAAREMGLSATAGAPDQTTITTASDGPAGCTPVADAGGPYTTNEGTNVTLDASASTENGDGPFTYEWDLDNDGNFSDATGASPSFTAVGQDGVYPIKVRITNADGFSSTASSSVTVNNVAPSVSIDAIPSTDEGTAVTLSGVISDPGWLDPLTATVDWGDGNGAVALPGSLENVRPDATLTYSVGHTYGDNGTFTVEVCGFDDDTSTCQTTNATITNVDPTATIDKSGATIVNGQATFFAHAGQPVPFGGNSQDPGSDDLTLTWDWGDGPPSPDVTTTSLVNPPTPDPFPSPSVQPRNVDDARSHTFGDACLYSVGFGSGDDDGGTGSDSAFVVITGNANAPRGAGWWQTNYRPRPTALSESVRLCYLEITGFMSQVFDEVTDASTIAKAYDVLFLGGNGGSAKQQLDRQLLTTWLNFANGAFELGTLVDTDGDGIPDTSFATAIANAEAIRLNPGSTDAQLRAQKDVLERING
jgi:hypothetical protein